MLRVALVGAGGMAGMHARCYSAMHESNLVAVMDTREEAAGELASANDALPFTSFDEMLESTRPDIVDVCCPTPWHEEYVCRAAQLAGRLGIRGISTEKPMARNLQGCRDMISAANQAGIPLFVAHVVRFFPEFARIKALVDGGAVGAPAAIRTHRGGTMPRAWDDWYANYAA
ncbi:MAG TPA: Gfo/Idh/MocA family oxidoreductase, partial [Chthonomonadales bacterium]|nr:Gfo/Idh/MocA family oxidoreductase [Chthonomonadales bacterium]